MTFAGVDNAQIATIKAKNLLELSAKISDFGKGRNILHISHSCVRYPGSPGQDSIQCMLSNMAHSGVVNYEAIVIYVDLDKD